MGCSRTIAGALALACLLSAGGSAQARTASVGIGEFFYRADRVRIDPGDTVAWTNRGEVLHTVTTRSGAPQGFDSGNIETGQSFTRSFTQPGTYRYLCTLHETQMFGVVQVGPDRTKPRVSAIRVRSGRRAVVAYRVSEESRVSVKVTRRGRTVRSVSSRRVKAGSVRAALGRLAKGRYRIAVTATDLEGNRATTRTLLSAR